MLIKNDNMIINVNGKFIFKLRSIKSTCDLD